jgi:hypothetical protein
VAVCLGHTFPEEARARLHRMKKVASFSDMDCNIPRLGVKVKLSRVELRDPCTAFAPPLYSSGQGS